MLGVFFCFVALGHLQMIQVDRVSDLEHTLFETYMNNEYPELYRSAYVEYADLLVLPSKDSTDKVLPFCSSGSPTEPLTFIYIDLPEPEPGHLPLDNSAPVNF